MRLYFASDIHGSERCFRKFLAAARFYEADAIVLGGDITGKFVVAIIEEPDGTRSATFHGVRRRVRGADELAALHGLIADAGSYGFETTREEYDRHQSDPGLVDRLFERLVLERVERWVGLADEKLDGTGVRCFVSGGNDDFYGVDEVLAGSRAIENPDGRLVELDGAFEYLAVGHANETPWNCPRDLPETELAPRIATLAEQVREPARAIFALHVPPYDSGLDTAPRLDEELRVVTTPSGEPELVAVGSTAVRDALLAYQPMLGLHGHIHESRGIKKLGATTIGNPGSEYQEGVLNGLLIELDRRKGIRRAQLVTG